MAYGGKGVARRDGKVYFIADAVAGDLVTAEVTSDNGRYAEAQVVGVLRPSLLRGPARCPYAHACGGCQWMGIGYDQQVAWKQGFVKAALTRIGKLPDTTAVPIIPAPAAFGYRNRILVRLHLSADGTLALGYFRRQSRELIPISRCEIAAEPINELLLNIHSLDLARLGPLKARLEIQEIPAVAGRNLVLTLYPGEGPRQAMADLARCLGEQPGVHWSGLVFDVAQAPSLLFDQDLDRTFLTAPGQFQQVNLRLNQTLRRLVKEHVEATGAQRILDVFCGSGNLSLPLADGVRYVEGIEANKQAIAIARRNAEANLLTNVRYLAGDAEKHLWKCDRGGERFDLILLDPPRQGIYKGMVPLKNIAPDHIIYVSCDPSTLARDLGYLCRGGTYELTKVVALDFFPNTFHVETVAFLRRSAPICQ